MEDRRCFDTLMVYCVEERRKKGKEERGREKEN